MTDKISSSRYGEAFDRIVERWAVLEDEHDRQHPDRGDCGGVGRCSMMFAASTLEREIVDALDIWRDSIRTVAEVRRDLH